MKLLKALTAVTLIFSLFTLQVELSSLRLQANQAYADDAPVGQHDRSHEAQKAHTNFPLNMMLLWASMIAAPFVIKACKTQPSALIFAGGAASVLLGEILTYTKFKELSTSSQKMIATMDEESANNQIEVLNQAAEQEQRAADALKSKRTYTSIAAYAYTAGSILAMTVEIFKDWPKFQGDCMTASIDRAPTQYYANNLELDHVYDQFLDQNSLASHMAQKEDYSRFLNGENKSLSINEYQQDYQMMEDLFSSEMSQNVIKSITLVPKLLAELVLPTAQAEEGRDQQRVSGQHHLWKAGVGAVVAAGISYFALKSTAAWVTKVMTNGWTRAAVFGGFAGAAFWAAAQLKKDSEKLASNAQIYRDLANKLEIALEDRYGVQGPNQGMPNNRRPPIGGRQDPGNTQPDAGSICISGNLGERRIDPECKCRQTNTCATVNLQTYGLGGYGLPSTFTNGLGTFGGGVNSFLAGNTAGADTAANAFGQNAASNLKRLKAQVLAKLNKEMEKNKKKPVNLEALEESMMKDMGKQMERVLASMSPQQLASLGGSTGSNNVAEKLAEKMPEAKTVLASIQAPTANDAKAASGMDFNFDFGEEENQDNAAVAVQDINYEEALDGYATEQNDISGRKNENIFNIITVRYFKSAYPRFFQEELD